MHVDDNETVKQEGTEEKKKQSNNDGTLEFMIIKHGKLVGLNNYIHETIIMAIHMDVDRMVTTTMTQSRLWRK